MTGKTDEQAYATANVVVNDLYSYLIANELHINIGKSVHMHFHPRLSNDARQTCARTRACHYRIRLGNSKLKQVDVVKFLGVMIADLLSWEPQIKYLKKKLNSSILIIKRIKKFIPESEYMKLYDALFKSHLSYCISCWGGISSYKLNSVFSLQKRCVRLLFGTKPTYDHASFYETCARVRTYEENLKRDTDFTQEHTKVLFNDNNILTLHHLYVQHTFVELFKIMKYRVPISAYCLFTSESPVSILSCNSLRIRIPSIKLDISKHNFKFLSTSIWNNLVGSIFVKCKPNTDGMIIPGSEPHTDILSTSISYAKSKLKSHLYSIQKLQSSEGLTSSLEWTSDNFFKL